MAKVSIQTIENLQNESSAIGRINSNFQALQAIIETLLSRDGKSPNQMLAVLDMNNRRLYNLPVPESYTDAARHGDLQQYVDQAEAAAEDAEESAEAAAESQAIVEALAEGFASKYIGAFDTAPVLDTFGNAITEGALYWNVNTDQLMVYVVAEVFVVNDPVLVGAEVVENRYWEEIPQTTLRSLADVDADVISNNQMLVWNGATSSFVPVALTALRVIFDPTGTGLVSTTVDEAIKEIAQRTLLDRYDFSVYVKGLLVENDTLFRMLPMRSFTLTPTNLSEFRASAVVASTGTQVLTLRKNGTQFGTVTFTASATGVWSIPGATSFSNTDVFTITTGTPVDTTLKNISLTFAARR